MAEFSTPEERTEMPSERRMSQLRREGGIHMSTEVVSAVTLMTGFYMLQRMWSTFFEDFKILLITSYRQIASAQAMDVNSVFNLFISILKLFGPHLFIFVVVIAGAASLSVMLQTNWNIKEKKLNFKWDVIHPIQGLKRILSVQGIVNTLKAIVKLALILPIGYFGLVKYAPDMVKLMNTSTEGVLTYVGVAIASLFWKIMYLLIAIAIFDYFWGKHRWLKTNKMTKDEIKDERKSIEGDEATKRKIVAKGLQRIMQRIMNTVPKADVVVTNPTHFAVALKYDRDNMSAPIVVAKGQDFLCQRIKEIARQHNIPILERKALARALYASTEVGSEIPHDLFRAVAEVLAYVFRLRKPKTAVSATSR